VATVWQGNTLVYSAADVGAPRPLAPFTHDDVSIYPFGWFINYGGWLVDSGSGSGPALLAGREMGSASVPVSPFEPGGLEGLEKLMQTSAKNSWIFDLKHAYGDDDVAQLVERFKHHPALRGWYIADGEMQWEALLCCMCCWRPALCVKDIKTFTCLY
jgi:hypothetical protein